MSQCSISSCAILQSGGACPCLFKNTLKGGTLKGNKSKKRVRFTKYVKICNNKSPKWRKHRKTHKKLPKNCKNKLCLNGKNKKSW